jgi:hypothetical protein
MLNEKGLYTLPQGQLKEVRTSQINQQMDNIDSLAVKLSGLVGKLEERLSAVLLPVQSNCSDTAKEPQEQVALAESLRLIKNNILNSVDSLQDIYNRLGL